MDKSLDYYPLLWIIVGMYRKQIDWIIKDLNKKMVFIVGPRQVGKTWLATEIGNNYPNTVYLNYDRYEDRKIIEGESWLSSTELIIFDELHKMNEWKNYLKGVFDTRQGNLKIILTGSARLDAFRQGGDSMAGRFFIHRLLPFSMAELDHDPLGDKIQRFIERGGFPEPFLAEDEVDAKRWRMNYIDGLIRNDILDFGNVHDLKKIQMILELLRRRVGSPVSFTSIARDVQVSPTTVIKYIEILEALYIVFRIVPYSKNIARSVLKEPKIYFYDNGMVVGDEGILFENFAAISLLKHVYAKVDYQGEPYSLKYLRTKDGKEVDFCIVKGEKIEHLIEVKNREKEPDKNLMYFCDKYEFKGIQVVKELKREKTTGSIDIFRADKFMKELFL